MSSNFMALGICLLAAALEGAAAGPSVKARFSELRLPPFSPTLPVWVFVGLAYYVICFLLLQRLLAAGLSETIISVLFFTLLGLMLANAAWGFLFFRRRDLWLSFVALSPYVLVAYGFGVLLLFFDRVAAAIWAPYLLYLPYATWWGYQLWRLNTSQPGGLTPG